MWVVNTVLAATHSSAASSGQAARGQRAHALQHQERGVALVDVPDGGLELQRLERAHAADAEHDFLLDAGGAVAAVQLVRDVAGALVVLLQVGVEQVQGHVAAACAPHLAGDAAAGQLDVDLELGAVRAH